MKIQSIGNQTIAEVADDAPELKSEPLKPWFHLETLDKSDAAEDHNRSADRDERLGKIIDLVGRNRLTQAKNKGLSRARVLRAYSSIKKFEDDFIFKGRFYRTA
ncbi:MAG: hypothetical protein AB8E15_08060 [Bdellovibrionales bacterium]